MVLHNGAQRPASILPRSYLGPISLLPTRTSLNTHSIYLHSDTLPSNLFQVLVARPRYGRLWK
jgi:hypothetical protein